MYATLLQLSEELADVTCLYKVEIFYYSFNFYKRKWFLESSERILLAFPNGIEVVHVFCTYIGIYVHISFNFVASGVL